MTDLIRTETANRICRIEMARTDKKNALTAEMYQALADGLRSAENDPATRAVLIHGTPTCFSAGNDLSDFLRNPPHDDSSPVWQFLQAISTHPKPIVAAVGGPAVGIGTTMLLHCDFVYATPATRFQLPFTSLGVVPEAASSLLLPLAAGYQRAAELLLLARPFNTEKALSAGIVTEVVPEADLLEYAMDAAKALAALPPESVRLTKAFMKRTWAAAAAERMSDESHEFRKRLLSPEAKEAFSAFLEKRPADFSKF